MTAEFISRSRLYIDFSGGNFQLKQVEDCDEDDDSDSEVKTAIGVQGGAGHSFKEGGGALKLSVFRATTPEVNWRLLKRTRERFSIRIDEENGENWKYLMCVASKVTRKINTQGVLMDSVDVKWLQREQLPSQPQLF